MLTVSAVALQGPAGSLVVKISWINVSPAAGVYVAFRAVLFGANEPAPPVQVAAVAEPPRHKPIDFLRH